MPTPRLPILRNREADEAVLERLVGAATLARGRQYFRSGAVRARLESEGGTHVVGKVQGSEPEPYYVSVTLDRSGPLGLSSFRSTCTCPVGGNCKHAVALWLARDPSAAVESARRLAERSDHTLSTHSPGAGTVEDRTTVDDGPVGWEGALRSVLEDPEQGEGRFEPATVGLQFELVTPAAASRRPPAPMRDDTDGPTIQLRPVVPSRAGNWVRTGAGWGNLDYAHYSGATMRLSSEQARVLKELVALSRMEANRYASRRRAPEVVHLEAINSRRLWDLLAEAQAVGIPLLMAGRGARPVVVHRSTASVALDVTRDHDQLVLGPTAVFDDQPLPTGRSLLLGRPVHGIAWWHDGPVPTGVSPLELAPLDGSVDDRVSRLLVGGPVEVPEPDQDLFLTTYLPTLRGRVPVRSTDASVELPESGSPVLVLAVHHHPDHRVVVSWSWGTQGSAWREGLWASRSWRQAEPGGDSLVDAVERVVGEVGGLHELARLGPRLAPESELSGIEAVRFVTEQVPVLAAIDGVEVEHVGTVQGYHHEEAALVVTLGGAPSGDGDWFDLAVSVTVAEEHVPFAELFTALAEGRSHLILPSGTYFALDRQELSSLALLIAEARALSDSSRDGVRISRFQAGLWDDFRRIGVAGAQADAWTDSVRTLVEATDDVEYPVPSALCGELRPYQLTGFQWLASLYRHRLGGVLADDMGLGKTVQAIALVLHVREQRQSDQPFLVVAPTSVVGNWADECRRFAPTLNVATITETTARRGDLVAEVAGGADVVITSYSLFRLEYEAYDQVAWAGLFLDEAQFAKNRTSQAYQKAKLLPTAFKLAMTGTPIENNLMELWSLLSITAPGLFPDPDAFALYYRVPIERNADAERLALLRKRVRPLMLRRTKDEVAEDLPDKQEQVLELELAPKHQKIYQTHLQRERQKVLGLLDDVGKHRFEIFRSLTLLRQASLDVSLVDASYEGVPSTKLDALMEMLDDIVADGHRVLVFSQFTRFLGLARQRIEAAGIGLCYLDGKTRKRDRVIDEFRTGDAPVFLISLKAGGFGLNLTEADYCILLDPWWNPATEAQAVDRTHRIGQTRKVMVYRLVAKGTVEEKVMALKEKKSALFASVLDAGGLESGQLTASDIRDLLE